MYNKSGACRHERMAGLVITWLQNNAALGQGKGVIASGLLKYTKAHVVSETKKKKKIMREAKCCSVVGFIALTSNCFHSWEKKKGGDKSGGEKR